MDNEAHSKAIYRLDAWFQTMRDERGYAGPIMHWWQSIWLYCGPMADWRYEGLICGYLNLHTTAPQEVWLDRAVAAGQDLLKAQLPDGRFWNSGFQVGPIQGGTPHEAAVDLALLELARVLRANGDDCWQAFFQAAEINLQSYQLAHLWDGTAFRDQVWNQVYVPNKNATTLEALLLYQELSGRSMEPYIMGAVRLILSAQVAEPGPRSGATVHLGTGDHRLTIGIYTARCLAALVRLYEHDPEEEYLQSAARMLEFLLKLVVEDGTLFGFYPDGRPIACPTWVSPSGDLLRAMLALKPYAPVPQWAIDHLAALIVSSQQPSGGIPTARGLGQKGSVRRPAGTAEFRDLVPVVGWCDKSFRALTMLASEGDLMQGAPSLEKTELECQWKGRDCIYREDEECMELVESRNQDLIFQWKKGEWAPSVCRL